MLAAAHAQVARCASQGIRTEEMQDLLRRAQDLLREAKVAEALGLVSECQRIAEEAGHLQETARSAIASAEESLQDTASSGVDVGAMTGRLEAARQAYAQADYRRALEITERLQGDLEAL